MLKKIGRIILYLIIFFFLSTIFTVIVFKWLPVRYTPLMAVRYFENINNDDYRTLKKWKLLDAISPNMVCAVIASEDNKFMEHSGFDWVAIKAAMEHNKKEGKRRRGGSSISQQVAKNVFLTHGQNWIRKGLEAYFTVLIEFFWSKERIMEVYLNIIETGKGIYGVEAAAQYYFKKSAQKLTREESALIASILPAPLRRDPANPTSALKKRQQQILKIMRQMGNVGF